MVPIAGAAVIETPGGVWLEPADVGFNATLVAAAANVNGSILPWRAGYAFRFVGIFWGKAGVSNDFTLRVEVLDADGQTQLVAVVNLWSNITGNQSFGWWFDNTPRVFSGVGNPAPMSSVLSAPYLRFNVLNNDGVNDGNVTVRVLLGV